MRILGIETSCDETAAAIVENGTKILSNIVTSSEDLQKKFGGILPEQAAREQVRYMIPVLKQTIDNLLPYARRYYLDAFKNIDAIAATVGPGLIGSLLVGVETAKTIAFVTGKPVIPINHHLGHIYASWLTNIIPLHFNNIYYHSEPPKLPAVCLIASGGHTLLVLMKGHGKWEVLGQTRDDAAGEAFDKTARLLGFSYPGGPEIEKTAKYGHPKVFPFPRPMIDSSDYDFSFSGLKTAVLREVQSLKIMERKPKTKPQKLKQKQLISDLAAGIQEAIVDVLLSKTLRAAKQYKVKSIIIGGGVAANKRLKEKFVSHLALSKIGKSQLSINIPPPFLCTDNAAVIAAAAYFNYKPLPWDKIATYPSLGFPV